MQVTHTQREAIAVAVMAVVMTQGRIEQTGTAQEIYTRPRSADAARFMGGHNVLRGYVVATANSLATPDTDGGKRYVVPMPQATPSKNTVVWFAVRRDRTELAHMAQDFATPPAEPNARCGTVLAMEYQGSSVRVSMQRCGPEDVIPHLPDRAFCAMQLKMVHRVVARWSPEDVHPLHAARGCMHNSAIGMRPYGKGFDALPT